MVAHPPLPASGITPGGRSRPAWATAGAGQSAA